MKPGFLLNQGRRGRRVVAGEDPQLLPLLDPAQGNMCAQFLETQITGLTSFEDGLDDVRR